VQERADSKAPSALWPQSLCRRGKAESNCKVRLYGLGAIEASTLGTEKNLALALQLSLRCGSRMGHNPSIERTAVGKPPAAAHVER